MSAPMVSIRSNFFKICCVIVFSAWSTWTYMYLVDTTVHRFSHIYQTPTNHTSTMIEKSLVKRSDVRILRKPAYNRSGHSGNGRRGTKYITTWTTYFGDPNWELGDFNARIFARCEYSDCVMSNDRATAEKADLILFHCRDDVYYWPRRLPQQLFGLVCQESQIHSDFRRFNFMMNISVTHREDSDLQYAYFKFVPTPRAMPGAYVPLVPLADRVHGEVVWPVSNCLAPSRREDYAKELSRYISVHIYGHCGTYSCPRFQEKACFQAFEKRYKFYLAFENTFCEQYVTEKFSNGLTVDLIPVVYGLADYQRIAPPHSYIDTRDFDSPEELATYLKYLSGNETAFNEYFQWKRHYRVYRPTLPCELCKFLHKKPDFHRDASTFDISSWWKPQGVCTDISSSLLGKPAERNSPWAVNSWFT